MCVAGGKVATAMLYLGTSGVLYFSCETRELNALGLIYLQDYFSQSIFNLQFLFVLIIPDRETNSLAMYFTLEQLQHFSQLEPSIGRVITDSEALLCEPPEASEKQTFPFTHLKAAKQQTKCEKLRKFANIFMKNTSDLVIDINQNISNISCRTLINVKKMKKFHKSLSDLKKLHHHTYFNSILLYFPSISPFPPPAPDPL